MSRINRFIFNSDYMTLARLASTSVIFTIPAMTLPSYNGYGASGTLDLNVDVPKGAILRMRAQYTGTNATNTLACGGNVQITENKGSGKTIDYFASIVNEGNKLKISYSAQGTGFTESSVLTTAQTIKLYLDFLNQPNT